MHWIRLRLLALALSWVAGGFESMGAQAQAPNFFSNDLKLFRGTLAVAVIESNQIVIAIDSRLTMTGPGKTNRIQDGFEKIRTLSPDVGFFVTGVNRFEAKGWTNSLNETAKTLAQIALMTGQPINLERLANEFKKEIAAEWSRCTVNDIYQFLVASRKYGGSNVFSAAFVGKDADSSLKMLVVTCRATVNTNSTPPEGHFDYDIVEHKFAGRRSFEFFGVGQVFARSNTEPKSRVASAIRQIRSARKILAEPIAAALLDVGVSELGDGPESPVGYPLFVYVADAGGFRLTRKVNKGAGVPFDYRNQPSK